MSESISSAQRRITDMYKEKFADAPAQKLICLALAELLQHLRPNSPYSIALAELLVDAVETKGDYGTFTLPCSDERESEAKK